MSVRKSFWMIARCFCTLLGAVGFQTNAAAAHEISTITTSNYWTYSVAKTNITSLNYSSMASPSDLSGVTVASVTRGKKITLETSYDKTATLRFVVFSTKIGVPANTAFGIKQTFTISGTRTVSNKRATAPASYQLVELGTSLDLTNAVIKPMTPNTPCVEGLSVGTSLCKGYIKGTASGTEATLNTDVSGTIEKIYTYQNDTSEAKEVYQYFGLWVNSQYGSNYNSSAQVECTVTVGDVAETNGWGLTDKPVTYGLTTNPGIYGDRNDPKGYTFEYTVYSCNKNGENRKHLSTTTFDANESDDKLYFTPADLSVGEEHYYFVSFTSKNPTDGASATISKVVKVTVKKADPWIETASWPVATRIDLADNNLLSASTISGGAAVNWENREMQVPGTYAWKDGNTVVTKTGTQRFYFVFTPDDTVNYNVLEARADVSVICSHIYGDWVGNERTCTRCGYVRRCSLSVAVTWDAMKFICSDGDWNPETHECKNGGWTKDALDGDKITVGNDGEPPVKISFAHEGTAAAASAVSGNFIDDSGKSMTAPLPLEKGEAKYARPVLSGKPSENLNQTVIGRITVTLEGN